MYMHIKKTMEKRQIVQFKRAEENNSFGSMKNFIMFAIQANLVRIIV